MNSRIVKIFIFSIIMLLICLVCILYLYMKNKNSNNSINIITNSNINGIQQNEVPELITDNSLKELNDTDVLLGIQECINTYYEYNYAGNTSAILNILNSQYISTNDINEKNLFEKINKIDKSTSFFAIKVYEKEISYSQEYQYYVYGKTFTGDYENLQDHLFVLNMDLYNRTFYLVPYDNVNENAYTSKINELLSTDKGGKKKVDNNTSQIGKNEYNTFIMKSDANLYEAIIENYLKYFYYLQKTNQQNQYDLLDKTYASQRFGNINNFNDYTKNVNYGNVKLSKVALFYTSDNKPEYVGIDNNGKYYIIIETSAMKFSILLDSYTVPLVQSTKRYSEATQEQKACMCLETVKEMINNKDYSSIYKHLNSTYKENNFKTVDQFKKFIDSKYYNNNIFKYESYELSSESYNVTILVSNFANQSENKNTNVVIKLGKDLTDFQLAFNVN